MRDESFPESDAETSHGGPWAIYEQIDSQPNGQFYDSRHQKVQKMGRKLLHAALEESATTNQSLDKLWETFRDYVRTHEYSEAIAREVARSKPKLTDVVLEDYAVELRAEALAITTRKIKDEIYTELREKLEKELTPHVEIEVRQRLSRTFDEELRKSLTIEIRSELTPKLRDEIRASLMFDDNLRAEVVADIKRKLVGL